MATILRDWARPFHTQVPEPLLPCPQPAVPVPRAGSRKEALEVACEPSPRRRAHGLPVRLPPPAPTLESASSEAEPTPEEKRALERKLKKERKKAERKRLREAAAAPAQPLPARPAGAQLALDYLWGWAQKRQSWRFQKTRQTWLLLHMYDCDQVPDRHFPTLLAYLEGLRGRARELTVQKAEALMRQLDEAGAGPDCPLLERSRRARQVLQLLS